MPKQVQKFARFEGGINEGADPRDVSENELAKSDNVTVDDLGKLRLIGKVDSTSVQDYVEGTNIKPGYGLFSYSTDYDADGALNNTDWVAVLNEVDGNVELRHTTDGTTALINNAIDLGGDLDDTEAQYYFSDGALRVSQANLSKNKDTRWYGFIRQNFYNTTDGKTNSGTPLAEKSAWVSTTADPKSPSELSVSLDLHPGETSNPGTSTVGSTAGDKIILSYWTSHNGGWNGVFSFGATFVYKGGAESAMDKFAETISATDQKVAFQVVIPVGTSSTLAADFGNGFGDDRIVGINIYFREFESLDYRLLTKVDLVTGGENHWLKINAATHEYYGVFDSGGSVVINSTGPVKTTEGTEDHWSYAATSLNVVIDNDADGFTGRRGYVRLYGANTSPLYVNATTNLGDGTVTFPSSVFKNAGPGERVLKAELLDESFNILKESAEVEYTIADSGKEKPPDTTQDDGYEEYDYSDDCFLWNTQILMASGNSKDIKDVRVGDIVLSYSDKYKSFTNGVVTDTLIHPKNDLIHAAVVGNSLVTTRSHPIFVNGKWNEVQYSGVDYSIIDIYVDNFYNLEIDGQTIYGSEHNFIANRYIVSGLGDNDVLNKVIPRQSVFIKDKKYG